MQLLKNLSKKYQKIGFEESKARRDHWLGRGIYFYQNVYYAIEWGIIRFIDENDEFDEYIEKCAIIEAILDLEDFEFLDLNDPIDYIYYLKIIDNIKKRFPEKIKKIENGNDIEIIRLMEELEEETGEEYISAFDMIMADYPKEIYKKGNRNKTGNFLPCIQKQICVKNKDVIKKIKELNLNDDSIKTYFCIIKKNRRENKNEKQDRTIGKIGKKNNRNTR